MTLASPSICVRSWKKYPASSMSLSTNRVVGRGDFLLMDMLAMEAKEREAEEPIRPLMLIALAEGSSSSEVSAFSFGCFAHVFNNDFESKM